MTDWTWWEGVLSTRLPWWLAAPLAGALGSLVAGIVTVGIDWLKRRLGR